MTEPLARWTEIAETRGLRIVAILIAAFLLTRLLKALTSRLVVLAKSQARTAQMREQQTRTVAGLLYSAGCAVIALTALLTLLPEFGFNVTPFTAAAGLASLAVGFGAQHLVRDVINGFFIVFEDQYVVGDVISANGETGRVEHLTLRRTVLRNDRGALVSIPNGLIGQVANLNRDWSQVFLQVTVASSESVGRALAVLEKTAGDFRNDANWSQALVDGPRVLGVESITLDGTNLSLFVRTAPNRQDDVARELRRRIKIGFEQARILVGNTQRVEVVGHERGAGAQ